MLLEEFFFFVFVIQLFTYANNLLSNGIKSRAEHFCFSLGKAENKSFFPKKNLLFDDLNVFFFLFLILMDWVYLIFFFLYVEERRLLLQSIIVMTLNLILNVNFWKLPFFYLTKTLFQVAKVVLFAFWRF